MDRKDLKTLMEAYDEIASIEVSPEVEVTDHDSEGDFSRDVESHEDLSNDDFEEEKKEMVSTRLRSLIAHAHQALDAIRKGSIIEPWMQDLITTSEGNVVKAANSLVYKHDID